VAADETERNWQPTSSRLFADIPSIISPEIYNCKNTPSPLMGEGWPARLA